MKRLIILMSSLFLLVSFKGKHDDEAIINALKSGNASVVIDAFDSFIDLKLPEKDELKNVGKNQAGIAVKSFFSENNIRGFDLASTREMGGVKYIAGKLQNGGSGYNITIMMKQQGANAIITTIRIN